MCGTALNQQQDVTGGLLLPPGAEPPSPSLSTTMPFRDRAAPTNAGPAGACPLLCAASSASRRGLSGAQFVRGSHNRRTLCDGLERLVHALVRLSARAEQGGAY